ncbi:unnamed protein product [Urochloa decumbens]|uniref:RBR-type E3 ubiquitin transferase n=1 Tax=Urochloa decumbens TaxID=240449 RepID=A0ABC9BN35_9POAL
MDTDGEFSDAGSDGDHLSDDECYEHCSEEEDDHDRDGDDEHEAAAAAAANVVLTEPEIIQRLFQEVDATAELLSVPADWALALLVHYRWDPLRLQEEWFADQDRVRGAVGLGDAAAGLVAGGGDDTTMACPICTEVKPAEEMASAGCAHYYCHDCWSAYVAAALYGGHCLALRCPGASCSRAVLRGMAEHFAGGDADAYARALARAYIEARRRWLKPCTSPGCGCVIEVSHPDGGGGSDLACRCGNAFCWRCGGAPHRPASCAAVARWAVEADAASADWILLHTKPCPACRRRIEAAPGGCNRMMCAPPCNHVFCWGCLAPLPTVGSAPILHHGRCGRDPDADADEWTATEEEVRAEKALGRFLYYQDMWMEYHRRRRDAEAKLWDVVEHKMPRASLPAMREYLDAVAAAWEQVAEGWRVLGNACAHGQSLREAADPARRELFEYQRGEAGKALDRLRSRAMEKKLVPERLLALGVELANMTRLTRQCVENFARAVEEGTPVPRAAGGSVQ